MSRLVIPEATLDQHVLTLGKTRSGKSSAMRVLVEHLLDKEKPVCIIDPKGDWYGLKSSADGKEAGYPLVIFGGEHGDVPINSRSGSPVAELVATGNRSCIIDLGGWMPSARSEFLIDFLSTFFRTSRGRRWLVIDEVHNVAPQGKVLDPQAGKLLHWANRIASEGLGKGISLIAASQRPQKVHKDFVTSAETLIAMRVIHPLDRGAIKDWIDGCGDPEKGKDVLATLASNQRGQGWVWSPEIDFGPKRVQFPMFHTFDSFKARTSEEPAKLKGWADVDLKDVTKKLESVVKEAEAKDPVKLQAKIRELELALKIVPKVGTIALKSGTTMDPKAVERAMAPLRKLLEDAVKILVKISVVNQTGEESPSEGQIHNAWRWPSLEAELSEVRKLAKAHLAERGYQLDRLKREAEQLIERIKTATSKDPISIDVTAVAAGTKERVAPRFTVLDRPALPLPRSTPEWNGKGLPEGEVAILKACAQNSEGVERKKLTLLTGYKRSTRDAYIARLAAKGMVGTNGALVKATQEGIDALGSDYEPLPAEGPELRDYWLNKLPEGERRVLEVLLSAGGQRIPRSTIDEATGFKRSTRDAYLSRLITRRVVEVEMGEVKASASLF